jgi:hypothetical protein
LPAAFVKLEKDIDEGSLKALQEGRGGEDDSAGYALFKDPAVRKMQLQVHDFALGNEKLIYKVLAASSDPEHRSDAADALGYARQSKRQIEALVRASFDSDVDVRNSAIRALGVLLTAKPELGRYVPAGRFISLLSSQRWEDRNKASFLLMTMTSTRDPQLLGKLRAEAMPALIEMSQFPFGHAYANAVILGRVIGIEESELAAGKLSQPGKIEEIIRRARERIGKTRVEGNGLVRDASIPLRFQGGEWNPLATNPSPPFHSHPAIMLTGHRSAC